MSAGSRQNVHLKILRGLIRHADESELIVAAFADCDLSGLRMPESHVGGTSWSSKSVDTPPDAFAAFEATLKKLVAGPKKTLDRKVKAFKRRKKRKETRLTS